MLMIPAKIMGIRKNENGGRMLFEARNVDVVDLFKW
jgi:hypothetical protein